MTGHGEKQSRKDDDAIGALLSCATIAQAADKVGIGEKTLRRWMQEPAFAARYREARQQVVQHSICALQRATSQAVGALERNLECGSPAVEVQAARVILEQAYRATELDDLINRIEELERADERRKGAAA